MSANSLSHSDGFNGGSLQKKKAQTSVFRVSKPKTRHVKLGFGKIFKNL
jgi:hypothetical protein